MPTAVKTSTFFALMIEFGTTEIPLSACCKKYFGYDEAEAKRRAATQKLPVPVFRGGSQKSGWLVSATDLAERIDQLRAAARAEWLTARQEESGSTMTRLIPTDSGESASCR